MSHPAAGPPLPTRVFLKLTNSCNLACEMCAQAHHRRAGVDAGRGGRAEWGQLCDMVDAIAAAGRPAVVLWGGEPLLHPDAVRIVARVRESGLRCSIITNGTRLSDVAERLVAAGIDQVTVSVDGPPELHDRIRGRSGAFERMAQGIRSLHRARGGPCGPPTLHTACTITRANHGALEQTALACSELGVDSTGFDLPTFYDSEAGRAYALLMERRFGCVARHWSGFVGDHGAVDVDVLLAQLHAIRASSRYRARFVPNLDDVAVRAFFVEPTLALRERCSVVANTLCVEPNGDVVACLDFPDHVMGNLLRDGVHRTWNSPRFERFRTYLACCGPLPVCYKCCGLR